MNSLAPVPAESLPTLIDRATSALAEARTSAEVLEARDMARAAYDAAKSAARMSRAKTAHDSIISQVHRAQAHALAIRARAEMRLAEEYDDAQARGEVVGSHDGARKRVGDDNAIFPATAADLGLRRDEIHEARRFRDAETADPGVIGRTINGFIERGEEPTRAALRREIMEKPKPARQMDARALWLWGRLKDFERDGVVAAGAALLLSELTPPMREDVRRLAPLVREFLQQIEAQA